MKTKTKTLKTLLVIAALFSVAAGEAGCGPQIRQNPPPPPPPPLPPSSEDRLVVILDALDLASNQVSSVRRGAVKVTAVCPHRATTERRVDVRDGRVEVFVPVCPDRDVTVTGASDDFIRCSLAAGVPEQPLLHHVRVTCSNPGDLRRLIAH